MLQVFGQIEKNWNPQKFCNKNNEVVVSVNLNPPKSELSQNN